MRVGVRHTDTLFAIVLTMRENQQIVVITRINELRWMNVSLRMIFVNTLRKFATIT